MSQESCSSLDLEKEISESQAAHQNLLDYSRNTDTLILPLNQMMWSREQSTIITEHLNYHDQMALAMRQIKEGGPRMPKPSLPKRPKSKIESLFVPVKKRKIFNPQELHDYLRSKLTDQCEINKEFIVNDMWNIQGELSAEEFLNILRRATRQIKRCEAQMLLFYISFGTFLDKAKAWHEDNYNKDLIKESWGDWLKKNADYSDRHARRLRSLSRVLKDYPQFGLVGLPVSYFTTGKLENIEIMLSDPTFASYWSQPLPLPITNQMQQSQ